MPETRKSSRRSAETRGEPREAAKGCIPSGPTSRRFTVRSLREGTLPPLMRADRDSAPCRLRFTKKGNWRERRAGRRAGPLERPSNMAPSSSSLSLRTSVYKSSRESR
uniref:Uncharacterized protein n=1 Tax=Chromera velia CCMP2878 TaxID=1169474 RepID=A0A0G4F8G2_9ALVE|eukprot:Cvel_15758.t1-p1 / transcript=Cvel_15758.t1 / gene=Cvel_15758 / organism=Chromera_velia_CCMP2878 / gene_product=hypothetical protein / transcript_product=hypothetical protein / location=Cvel_scaffold1180:30577-30897(+) / protein_length=107 / sequence_SO=supercontig / SO=protein_coding / is_pseudo=false